MLRNRALYLFFLVTLAGTFALQSATPAQAQEYWCYVFNFIDNAAGWQIVNSEGEYVTNDGYHANDAGTGDNTRKLTMKLDIPTTYIRQIHGWYYSTTHSSGTIQYTGEYLRIRVNYPTDTFTAFNQTHFQHRPDGRSFSSNGINRDVDSIEISTYASDPTDPAPSTFKLTQIYIEATGTVPFSGGALVLDSECQYPRQIYPAGSNFHFESTGLNQQTAVLSTSIGGLVRVGSLSTGGESVVHDVRPATVADCVDFLGIGADVGNNDCALSADNTLYAVDLANVYYVAIDFPNFGLRSEFLTFAGAGYTNPGQQIGTTVGEMQGCGVGEVIPDINGTIAFTVHQMRAIQNNLRILYGRVDYSSTYPGICGFNVPQSEILTGDLWCREFDFTIDQQGWIPAAAQSFYEAGIGWTEINPHGRNEPFRWAIIGYTHHIPQLEEVEIYFDFTGGNKPHRATISREWQTPNHEEIYLESTGITGADMWAGPSLLHWEYATTPPEINTLLTLEVSPSFIESGGAIYPGEVTITKVILRGRGGEPFPAGHGEYISGGDCVIPNPLPDLVRPYKASDLGPWGIINSLYDPQGWPDGEKWAFAFSSTQAAPVHAPVSGIVTRIERVVRANCDYRLAVTAANECLIYVGDEVTGTGLHLYELQENYETPVNLEDYQPYSVTIRSGDIDYIYFVNSAPNYVSVDSAISAGCIMGESAGMAGVDIGFGIGVGLAGATPSFGVSSNISPYGITVVNARIAGDNLSQDPVTKFTIEPPADAQPCSQSSQFLQCINADPAIKPGGNEWTTTGLTTESNEGGILTNGQVYQMLNIDPAREPEIIVSARATSGPATMQIFLGSTPTTVNLTSTYYEYRTSWSETNLFLWRAGLDSGANIIRVKSICVRNTKDDEGEDIPPVEDGPGTGEEPPPQPVDINTGCSFLNASFDDGSNQWTTGTGVGAYGGLLNVPDDGTFSQSVSLEENQYYLRARAALTTSFTYDITGSSPGNVLLQYSLTSDGSSWVTVETEPIAAWANGNQREFTTSINITEAYSGPIHFRVTFDENVDAGVTALAIDYICLNTSPAIVDATCTVVTEPTTNDFGAWISWHWANTNNFFQCDLMVMLNEMYSLMYDAYVTFGWSMRWFQATALSSIDWMQSQLLPWLAGYLANISPGTVYAEQQCNNLFCLITGLFDAGGAIIESLSNMIIEAIQSVIGPIVQLIIDVINLVLGVLAGIVWELIEFIFMILGEMVKLIIRVIDMLFGLLEAWNTADPEPLPGMPDCTIAINQEQNHICSAFRVAEFTILSGPIGSQIIPVAVGGAYLIFGLVYMRSLFGFIRGIIRSIG